MKLYCRILFTLFFFIPQSSFAQGLKFYGNEVSINKRTSYDVFKYKAVSFSEYFSIEFDLSLYPTTQIGYILRIKNTENNKIYNLFYDGQGDTHIFKFNEEGKSSLITTSIDKTELLDKHWIHVTIMFNLHQNRIIFNINDQVFSIENIELPDRYSPQIIFGKSDHIVDVPTFAIKNLSVGNNKRHIFRLKEYKGDIVHNDNDKIVGQVSNPEWLINDAYHWNFVASFKSEKVAGANYNPAMKEIYYFNRDSILIYNVRTGESNMRPFEKGCPIQLTLGTNFMNTRDNKLYAYEVYADENYAGSNVASLDLSTCRWNIESFDKLPTQLHHHAAYFDSVTCQYTIFGGFGNMYYSKNFYSYDCSSKKWKVSDDFGGDPIFPRYFSSMGYSETANSIYVFGGMGNESGEQIVGRRYFYDLHKIDLNTRQITKLWEIAWDHDNIVPVRGMVLAGDSCFYTLCYPEHFTDSSLRLYRFSLKDGHYEILGDSIPIHSDKIPTNANLYFDSQLNSLFAIVQEFDDDIISDLKVYSLAYTPIAAKELVDYDYPHIATGKITNTLIGMFVLGICGIILIGYFRYKKRVAKHPSSQNSTQDLSKFNNAKTTSPRPNSIYLFGDFMVRSKSNKDITYMFSIRLKEIFCILLQYSMNKGITSQRLSDLLWPDRPKEKVKNSRGVTINNLRKILNELDGIELVYEGGYFKIVQTDQLYCDYVRCVQILATNNLKEDKDELIEILTRGKLLDRLDQPLFDSFKEEIEHKLEPILLLEMERRFSIQDYKTTIILADIIFNIDPLNEHALDFQIKSLLKLKMNNEVQIKYQTFSNQYKKIMGDNYPNPYSSLD